MFRFWTIIHQRGPQMILVFLLLSFSVAVDNYSTITGFYSSKTCGDNLVLWSATRTETPCNSTLPCFEVTPHWPIQSARFSCSSGAIKPPPGLTGFSYFHTPNCTGLPFLIIGFGPSCAAQANPPGNASVMYRYSAGKMSVKNWDHNSRCSGEPDRSTTLDFSCNGANKDSFGAWFS